MKSFRTSLTVFVAALVSSLASADEPVAKLPADGWWARYFVATKNEFDGQTDQRTMKRTYSLVGTSVENGETCRWVEIKSAGAINGIESVLITKLLVPEKDLLHSDRPGDRIVRSWVKVDGDDVKAVAFAPPQKEALDLQTAHGKYSRELLVFPGLWYKAKTIEKRRSVEYRQGRLEIAQARAGSVEGNITGVRRQPPGYTFAFEFTVWADPKVAPVFAAATVRSANYVNGALRTVRNDEWEIEDIGGGAKSELPESN